MDQRSLDGIQFCQPYQIGNSNMLAEFGNNISMYFINQEVRRKDATNHRRRVQFNRKEQR